WAEPSVDHAAGLMRQVFEDRGAAAGLGEAARRDIESRYSAAAAGSLIRRRLEAVALRRRLPDFRREAKGRYAPYRRLPDRMREVVSRTVPDGGVVAVVSKGDADLVRLEGRAGWHFPRSAGGAYAGYYPADGAAAVAHLEEVRAQGAQYLLLPGTAFWWLGHYPEFRRHLETHCPRLHADEHCVIHQLAPAPRADVQKGVP